MISWAMKKGKKMKNAKTKNAVRLIALTLAFTLMLLLLSSCGNVAGKGIATLVIEFAEIDGGICDYKIDLSKLENGKNGAVALLDFISKRENGGIEYKMSGTMLERVGWLHPDPTHQFIAVYTSESSDFAVPNEWMPEVYEIRWNGILLKSAGVGLFDLSVKDGTVIYLRIEEF